jgi:cytochrome oxidase Cu insertion factor (SCO1/SenC/PrrC family)
MKKIILFHLIVLMATEFIGCTRTSTENKKEAVEPVQKNNDLPSMNLTTLNGTQVNTQTLTGKSILILFQPDCDHCQREAKEIREHIEAFRDYSVYFVSADPMPTIEKFAKDYDLSSQANFFFGMTTVESVLNNFGPIPAPSVYIYSDQALMQKFNGEVSIDKILQAL